MGSVFAKVLQKLHLFSVLTDLPLLFHMIKIIKIIDVITFGTIV